MTGVPLRRKNTERQRRMSWADWGRSQSDALASQRMPGDTRRWKRQGRCFPWILYREHGPTDTLTLDFQPLEQWENKPPHLWQFVMAVLRNQHRYFNYTCWTWFTYLHPLSLLGRAQHCWHFLIKSLLHYFWW